MQRMRKFLIVLSAAVALAVGGVVMYLRSRPLNTAQQVAVAYLQRWQAQDWKGMRVLVDRPPPTFTAVHAQMVSALSVSSLRITPGSLVVAGATAQKPFTVDVAVVGLGTWSYQATLHLVRPGRRWKVSWTPETLHPQLASDRKFARVLHWPDRAPILGRDGTVLQGQGDVVSVGVEPDRVKDPGTVVGLSGLEGAFERQLAGSPSADIQIVDTAGSVVATLDHFDGSPPQPVTTTLDLAVQTAADNTFAGSTQPAALVALDAATGEIRAVVSRPINNGFDRALAGTYPPGSTMKIVTTEALLVKGDDLPTPISCPIDAVVDGKHFHNIEGEGGTQLNLQQAFVQSCNTAFVQLAATLKASELTAAAANLGFNAPEPL